MIQSWSEDLFSELGKDLTDRLIFSRIQSELCSFIGQRAVIPESATSEGFYCGASFQKGQLLYHCSDCALDETCVLCEGCFDYETHKSHNFWYSICTDRNGSCDCGEEDSWRNELNCAKHRVRAAPTPSKHLVTNELRTLLMSLLDFALNAFMKYSLEERPTDDTAAIILYNDEVHSFDEVIEILNAALQIQPDKGKEYAELIDKKGFSLVHTGSISTCDRLSRRLGLTGLATSVQCPKMAYLMALASEIFEFVALKADSCTDIREIFVEWLLSTSICSSNSRKNIEDLFLLDHLLWKSVRKNFHVMLNYCASISQESKKKIALCYCKQYDKIFDYYSKEKREPHLSITRFSVQVFTLKPVAEYCLENSSILSLIFSRMIGCLEPGYHPETGLNVSSIRGFDVVKFSILLCDAHQLLRNGQHINPELVSRAEVLEQFAYLLLLLTHMDLHLRKSDEHVRYDKNGYEGSGYICNTLQNIAESYAAILAGSKELSGIWSTFDKFTCQSSFYSRLLKEAEESKPLYSTKAKCSFYGSLTWFYSVFIRELLKNDSFDTLKVPSRLVKVFALDALLRLRFSAEVKSGLWVRNGAIVLQQEYFYSESNNHHLTLVPDIFVCVASSNLMEKANFMAFLLKSSGLFSYLEEFDQNSLVINQILVLVLNCFTNEVRSCDSEQVLINCLCVESTTKSSLDKLVPEYIIEDTKFRNVLFNVATLKAVNSLGVDSKIELKKSCVSRYDPFFWAFPISLVMKSWNNVSQSEDFSILGQFSQFIPTRYSFYNASPVLFSSFTELFERISNSNAFSYSFSLAALLACLYLASGADAGLLKMEKISDSLSKFKAKSAGSPSISRLLKDFEAIIGIAEADVTSSNDDIKVNSQDRRSKLMASFKRQRGAFTGDSLDLQGFSDTGCVICSNADLMSDENPEMYGIPLQLNEFNVTRFTEADADVSQTGMLLRGCNHTCHLKCFESLPRIGNQKKCPICGGAIDFLFPLFDSQIQEFPWENAIPFNLSKPDTFIANEDEAVAKLCLDASTELKPVGIDSHVLFDSFCYTLLHVSILHANSLPRSLNIVSILNTIKQFIFQNHVPLESIRLNLVCLLKNTFVVDSGSILTDIGSIVYATSLIYQGEMDVAAIPLILQNVLKRQYHGGLANGVLKTVEVLNALMSLLLFGNFQEEPMITTNNAVIDGWKSESNAKSAKVVCLKPEQRFKLIDLPHRHDLYLRHNLNRFCDNCSTVPRSGAVCLCCGELVCVGQGCCRSDRYGESSAHRIKCTGSIGLFLLIQNCALLILGEDGGLVIPAPYVNVYGEHDMDIDSHSALYLNNEIYRGKLERMWLEGELRDYILRNTNDARLLLQMKSILRTKFVLENIPHFFGAKEIQQELKRSLPTNSTWNLFKITNANSKLSDTSLLAVNSGASSLPELVNMNSFSMRWATDRDTVGERCHIFEGRTLILFNFFPDSDMEQLRTMFQKYKLKESNICQQMKLSSNGRFLVVQFEDEMDCFRAYRELDCRLLRDGVNRQYCRRLRVKHY